MRIRIQGLKLLRNPGFEIFADPDPGLDFSQKISVICVKSRKRTLEPDQNADPDPGTPKNADPDPGTMRMRIWIQGFKK